MKKSAELTSCTNCHEILGDAAIKLADVEWDEILIKYPLAEKQNISVKNDAICTNCKTKFTYIKLARKFVVSSAALTD